MKTIPEGQLDSGNDSFIKKYCQRHQCQPQDFAEKVLWSCIHPMGIPLSRLIWLLNQDFFQSDLDLIAEVKDATSYDKIRETIKFFSKQPSSTSFVRHWMKARLSRGRLLKLAAVEMGANEGEEGGKPPA